MTKALKYNRRRMVHVPHNGDVVQPFRLATKISFAAMDNYVRNSQSDSR